MTVRLAVRAASWVIAGNSQDRHARSDMTDEGKSASVLRASCLCGGIRFEIRGPIVGINQCHCDTCRKESGTGSSTFIPVHAEQFTWISGADLVGEYRGDGWAIERCKVCGSLAPDHNRTRALYNIPAGLLDSDTGVEVAHHMFVGDKAGWDVIGDDAPQYDEDEGPPLI